MVLTLSRRTGTPFGKIAVIGHPSAIGGFLRLVIKEDKYEKGRAWL
jgi:hypothetical protein